MFNAIASAIEKKELHGMEAGAMCYMLSKQGYLSDRGRQWLPHLMFFVPPTEPAAWAANLPSSPIIAFPENGEKHDCIPDICALLI